jgi:AraC-like DNA-binding protein
MAQAGNRLYNSGMAGEVLAVRVNSCGRMRCAPDWSWDTAPGLPDYDLVTIHSGRGEYLAAEGAFPARAGTCLLLRAGARYRGSLDPADPMTVTWVHFDYLGARGRPVRRSEAELPGLHRALETPAFFFALLDRLLEAWAGREPEAAGAWLDAALRELRRQDARPRWSGQALEQSRAILELCARIRSEPGARWRAGEMAGRLYCTADHFARLFRRYAGASPGEFVVRARLDAAMGLLRSSSHGVKRIAELLGYPDISAFSRQFKAKTGLSPSAYRSGGRRD